MVLRAVHELLSGGGGGGGSGAEREAARRVAVRCAARQPLLGSLAFAQIGATPERFERIALEALGRGGGERVAESSRRSGARGELRALAPTPAELHRVFARARQIPHL